MRPGEGGNDAVLFSTELAESISGVLRKTNIQFSSLTDSRRIIVIRAAAEHPFVRSLIGVHRIQRIPLNDRRGRRHTSTATVVIMEDKLLDQVQVLEQDCRVKTKRGSGPGGQHRNKTDSAVQITHMPTGIVVQSEAERSQRQNKEKAKADLQRRLQRLAEEQQFRGMNSERRAQAQSPERSLRHFTWNVQRNEVSSHDGLIRYNMRQLLKGRIEPR